MRRRKVIPKRNFRELRRRMKEHGPPGVVFAPVQPGESKMSEALHKLVEPFIDMGASIETIRYHYSLAALAWTYSFLGQDEQKRSIQQVIDKLLPEETQATKDEMKEHMAILIKRKGRFFPDDQRRIADIEVSQVRGEVRLAVASVPVNAKASDGDGGASDG